MNRELRQIHERNEPHPGSGFGSGNLILFAYFEYFAVSLGRFCKSMTTEAFNSAMIPDMKTTQSTLPGGASVLASLGEDSRGGSRRRSPHRCAMLVVLMLVATLARAATNDLSGLLQRGLFEEEANRNLDAASTAYETLVKQFDKDRQIGATAVFRLGEVYRKQGKTNEAVLQYERIVRDFAEQTTLVTLSRQNLAGLGVKRIDVMPAGNDVGRFALENRYLLSKLQLEQAKATDDVGKIARLLEDQDLAQQQQRFQEVWRNYATNRSNKAEALQAAETVREARNELIRKREQELALLKRQLDQAQTTREGGPVLSSHPPSSATAIITDEEEAEIRRIQALLQNSPDLINGSPQVEAPLLAAARAGKLRVAAFLLDNKADIQVTLSGRTALHNAVQFGQKAMVELLLQRGASVDAKDSAAGRRCMRRQRTASSRLWKCCSNTKPISLRRMEIKTQFMWPWEMAMPRSSDFCWITAMM